MNSGNDVPGRISGGISIDEIKGQMTSNDSPKWKLTSHCIWANSSFPHLGLAHLGVALAFCDRPVMIEQSMLRWRSIFRLGSSPGGIGTGSLQRGPGQQYELDWTVRDGTRTMLTIRSYSVKFGFIVLWAAV